MFDGASALLELEIEQCPLLLCNWGLKAQYSFGVETRESPAQPSYKTCFSQSFFKENMSSPSEGFLSTNAILHRQTSAPSLSSARLVKKLVEERLSHTDETDVADSLDALNVGDFLPNLSEFDSAPKRSFSKKKNLRNLSVQVPTASLDSLKPINPVQQAARNARARSQSRLAEGLQKQRREERDLGNEPPPPSKSFAKEMDNDSPMSSLPKSVSRSITTLGSSVKDNTQHFLSRDAETIDLQPYKYGPSHILPYLYLGSKENAKSLDVVTNLGLKYFINVAEEVWNPLSGEGLAEDESQGIVTVEQVAPMSSLPKRSQHAMPIVGKKKMMGADDFVETPYFNTPVKKTISSRWAEFGVVREVQTRIVTRKSMSASSRRDWSGIAAEGDEVIDLDVKLVGRNTCFMDNSTPSRAGSVGLSPKDGYNSSLRPSPLASPAGKSSPPNGPTPPRPISISPGRDLGSPRIRPMNLSPNKSPALLATPLSDGTHILNLHSLHFPWTHGNLLIRSGTEDSPLEERPCCKLGFESELDMAFEIIDRARYVFSTRS